MEQPHLRLIDTDVAQMYAHRVTFNTMLNDALRYELLSDAQFAIMGKPKTRLFLTDPVETKVCQFIRNNIERIQEGNQNVALLRRRFGAEARTSGWSEDFTRRMG